jgi:hypothetical protein
LAVTREIAQECQEETYSDIKSFEAGYFHAQAINTLTVENDTENIKKIKTGYPAHTGTIAWKLVNFILSALGRSGRGLIPSLNS